MAKQAARSKGGRRQNTAALFFAIASCKRYRLIPALVSDAILFGKPEAMRALSRQLIDRHTKIRPPLVRWLAVKMVERCAAEGIPPPAELATLLRVHLKTDSFAVRETKGFGKYQQAVQYTAAYPEASLRKIAKWSGASATAVERWRNDSAFQQAIERLKADSMWPLMRELLDTKTRGEPS